MRTSIYVDGFNLYYRALKNSSYKWLNLEELCRRLLRPENNITSIKYFTANVKPRPNDPDQPVRQNIYLRALKTLPCVEIILGSFLSNTVRMPLAHPLPTGPKYVEVTKTEEKGSDVNIAAHLIHDAHLKKFDVAALITSDTDLSEPIRIITKEIKLPVVLLYPSEHISRNLSNYASSTKQIRQHFLRDSQFPDTLNDSNGTFSKPPSW